MTYTPKNQQERPYYLAYNRPTTTNKKPTFRDNDLQTYTIRFYKTLIFRIVGRVGRVGQKNVL